MTARPILFSAPMVRALLDGRKTQTRRILKPQPSAECAGFQKVFSDPPYFEALDAVGKPLNAFPVRHGVIPYPTIRFAKGDRLYVRERAWLPEGTDNPHGHVTYHADHGDDRALKWRPGIHMPRWASRLTLTVTDVRVERLQEISEADAMEEGVTLGRHGFCVIGVEHPNKDFPTLSRPNAREMYAALWDVINGNGAWLANPWVVAITFTVEQRNIDA